MRRALGVLPGKKPFLPAWCTTVQEQVLGVGWGLGEHNTGEGGKLEKGG